MNFLKSRKFPAIVLVIAMMLFMVSCSADTPSKNKVCNHSWVDATCIKPKTCSICEKTEGTPSSTHAYEGDKCKDCGLIKLTMENYEDYIDCNATVKVGDSLYSGSIYGYIYTSAECMFEATGNVHYKYNDVSIVIKFCHYDKAGYTKYLKNIIAAEPVTEEAVPYSEATYTVNLNLAGKGSETCELTTPWNSEKKAYTDNKAIFDRTTFEIVSISGTVQEY